MDGKKRRRRKCAAADDLCLHIYCTLFSNILKRNASLSVIMARIAFVSDVVYPWTKGGMEAIYYLEMAELAKNNEIRN